ncbi:CgeB family protein [Candidatus Laterigemmans baculatus]|uniref:CgeB family protein n=1 Tax=Candidatus Laterigemmans baculatus TaxID=2770505 RepID=UPI0013DB8B7F|nr:glycosyltransferase [Candidatus Laterigemmans baculatus]
MRIVLFYHSLVSCWNHGNAHFLRGVASEMVDRGHQVRIYEPADGWSLENLRRDHGEEPLREFERSYPGLSSKPYDLATFDVDTAVEDADVVLVHEWNDPQLVSRLGLARTRHNFRLLFHDTHHRAATAPEEISRYDLRHYDGVLAFGAVIRDLYLRNGWAERAWTWHEAADTRLFEPLGSREGSQGSGEDGSADADDFDGDLVWVGNWGDGERSEELQQYLLQPVRRLGLRGCVYGVRYPDEGLAALAEAGIEYRGWLANGRVPEVFRRYRCTVHVPRRPYRESLPGVPTIRVFEALACGIPLVSLRWDDIEGLFTPGKDYLVAETPEEMQQALELVLRDPQRAEELAAHGRQTILERHTCGHRVDELWQIFAELGLRKTAEAESLSTEIPSPRDREAQ